MKDVLVNIKPSTINRYDSRYRCSKILTYDDGIEKLETFEPYDFTPSEDDIFFEVTPDYENRLDLISYKFYDNPLYWWVIATASDIKDPSIVPVRTVLRVPSPNRLFSIKGVLRDA